MDTGAEAPPARTGPGRPRKEARNASGGINLPVHKPEPRMTRLQSRKSKNLAAVTSLRSSTKPVKMKPVPKQHLNKHPQQPPKSASGSSTLVANLENITFSPIGADHREFTVQPKVAAAVGTTASKSTTTLPAEPPLILGLTADLSANVGAPSSSTSNAISISGVVKKCATVTVATQVEHEEMLPDDIILETIRPQLRAMNPRQKFMFQSKLFVVLKEVFDDAREFPESGHVQPRINSNAIKSAPESAANNSGLPHHTFAMPGQNSTAKKLPETSVNAQPAFSGRTLVGPIVSNNGGVMTLPPLGRLYSNCDSLNAAVLDPELVECRLTVTSQSDIPQQRPPISINCNARRIKILQPSTATGDLIPTLGDATPKPAAPNP